MVESDWGGQFRLGNQEDLHGDKIWAETRKMRRKQPWEALEGKDPGKRDQLWKDPEARMSLADGKNRKKAEWTENEIIKAGRGYI